MIDTIRILVDWKCNLQCSYCCNKLPSIRARIHETALDEIKWDRYKTVCITGGEPLLFPDRIGAICDQVDDQLVVLYTNGTLLDERMMHLVAAFGVDAINVGLHSVQSFTPTIERITGIERKLAGCLAVRFHVEDIHENDMTRRWPHLNVRYWHRDECDRDNEHRVIITDWL